ncbi:CU044_2847 family protein [Streptomyces sp. NPDC056938]|uniref:CU044_2847 family protein n=1 Tax=unclassified Streptomyces TaxID=2593676 RepID=UPI00362DEF01
MALGNCHTFRPVSHGRHGRFDGVRDRGWRTRRLRGVRRDGVRRTARLARGPSHGAGGRHVRVRARARSAAESALRVFREGPLKPDGVEIEFGVKMSAEAGALIAKGTAEGHLVVKLSWSATDRAATDGA